MKEEILETKKKNPKAFVSIKEATKNKKSDFYCLGVLACYLENKGVTTAIERENNDDKNESFDIVNYIINGMLEKKKYNLSFDFGKNKNNNLLDINKKIRKKLAFKYNIPENEIIIISNLSKNEKIAVYKIQIIFQNKEFDNLDLKLFKQIFKNDELLSCLKVINSTLIMEGCKLNKNMIDPRGNKISGWEEGKKKGKRGGLHYFPPLGWIGFGLNVKGNYDNGNNDWLAKNGNKNEWAVAYCGVGTKRKGKNIKNFELEDEAYNNIFNKGFQNYVDKIDEDYENMNNNGQKFREDIYCSPKPSKLEESESFPENKNDIDGKKYKLGLMMRVKPHTIKNLSGNEDYWTLYPNINEIRPYRILIKENINFFKKYNKNLNKNKQFNADSEESSNNVEKDSIGSYEE